MSIPPIELVRFVPEESIRGQIAAAFAHHRRRLAILLPEAECHHVGSTAVTGSLTKGDLDIQLRVPAERIAHADGILAAHYERNMTSTHTVTFSSFKDDGVSPTLGIQLTAIGGAEDIFCVVRDELNAHPDANQRYNDLKRCFEGCPMHDYRVAKSAFLETLLEQTRLT